MRKNIKGKGKGKIGGMWREREIELERKFYRYTKFLE